MITSYLLTIFNQLIGVVLSPFAALHDVVLDPNLVGAITNTQTFIAAANQVLPVGTILAVLSIVILVEIAIFSYKGIMWVVRKIPGIS